MLSKSSPISIASARGEVEQWAQRAPALEIVEGGVDPGERVDRGGERPKDDAALGEAQLRRVERIERAAAEMSALTTALLLLAAAVIVGLLVCVYAR